MQKQLKEDGMIDEAEYKIARQWRLTGGAVPPPEHAPPPSQRSLRETRPSSPKQQQQSKGRHHSSRENEDGWSSDTDDENERRSPRSDRAIRTEMESTSRKRDELRVMLSSADITAVERAIDEHAGDPDAELQQLRRQLIQHREVSEQ